jgi:hypothetical protein
LLFLLPLYKLPSLLLNEGKAMAEVEDTRRRTAEVRVKLSPAMAERFSSIAEGRGVLPATLAALAIGEYVEKYDQQVRMGQMVALDASKRFADAFTAGDGFSKLLSTLINDPGCA